ncbi:MAG: CDP-diacylglycerol--serine O-phosphatidyltransferase [Polyangiales bacterium]|nr:CDP-diacylglycerol--serine O-phosphatidyltransferase [Myxococcales bacterium]
MAENPSAPPSKLRYERGSEVRLKLNLRKSLFVLPNLFTFSSIFCGFYAVLIASASESDDDFYRAAMLIVFSMFFDTIDGRVARLTKTQSAFGVQIDSLADVVSFGVAPAVLVYRWALSSLGVVGLAVSFAYLLAGAARLARFNVLSVGETGAPKKPGKYIMGLPIPGAAGILVSIVVANHAIAGVLPTSSTFVLPVVLALAFFMVSTIKFRSFKDLRLNGRTVGMITFALGACVVIALYSHIAFALVWLLASYIAIGVIEAIFEISRRGLARRRASAPDVGLDDDEDDPITEDTEEYLED